jgi:hypothetical protein
MNFVDESSRIIRERKFPAWDWFSFAVTFGYFVGHMVWSMAVHAAVWSSLPVWFAVVFSV